MPNKRFTITIEDKELSFEQSDGSLLSLLERHKINAPYQCREGFCGACRAKCNGSVAYPHEPLAFIREGEILLCCAQPTSDLELDLN